MTKWKIALLWMALLATSANAGFFRSEPFPAQRYPGERKADAKIARVQLVNSVDGVITRIHQIGEDRLWDDRRGWYNVWYGDFEPGNYVVHFRVSRILYDRNGNVKNAVYDTGFGKKSIQADLQPGHSYRIRATDAAASREVLGQPTSFILEDLGMDLSPNCFEITNLLADTNPSTGLSRNCKRP